MVTVTTAFPVDLAGMKQWVRRRTFGGDLCDPLGKQAETEERQQRWLPQKSAWDSGIRFRGAEGGGKICSALTCFPSCTGLSSQEGPARDESWENQE